MAGFHLGEPFIIYGNVIKVPVKRSGDFDLCDIAFFVDRCRNDYYCLIATCQLVLRWEIEFAEHILCSGLRAAGKLCRPVMAGSICDRLAGLVKILRLTSFPWS